MTHDTPRRATSAPLLTSRTSTGCSGGLLILTAVPAASVIAGNVATLTFPVILVVPCPLTGSGVFTTCTFCGPTSPLTEAGQIPTSANPKLRIKRIVEATSFLMARMAFLQSALANRFTIRKRHLPANSLIGGAATATVLAVAGRRFAAFAKGQR